MTGVQTCALPIYILKSSFDGDGINVGVAFHPQTGIIRAMPRRAKEMQESDYKSIISGDYFLR